MQLFFVLQKDAKKTPKGHQANYVLQLVSRHLHSAVVHFLISTNRPWASPSRVKKYHDRDLGPVRQLKDPKGGGEYGLGKNLSERLMFPWRII